MEVTLAKTAGFCFGVKKAVELAFDTAGSGGKVYTYGPIIHNEEVTGLLERQGVGIVNSPDEVPDNSTVIIRSHGAPQEIYAALEEKGARIVDATCPFVKNIHNIVKRESDKGSVILIIGNPGHAEVDGTIGWCTGEPYVINSKEDIESLPDFGDRTITVVSQTTYSLKKFQELVEIINNRYYNVCVCKTICNATEERQKEAEVIARDSDAMIVIGGKHSSNTQKLYEISKQYCKNTYYIQTLVDLDLASFESVRRVGITAGASTPEFIIKEVHEKMEDMTFEEMLQDDSSVVSIKPGQVIEGKVITVKPDELVVDIHYKSDGIVKANEYSSTPVDLTTVVKEGDPITVKVIRTRDEDGQVQLSHKRVAAEKSLKELEDAFTNKTVLKGTVTQVVSKGLIANVGEGSIFIPASLVSDNYERDLSKYKDQEIEFILIEYDPSNRRVIGNRKQVLLDRKKEALDELMAKVKVGDEITGKVKNLTDFGAFIDLGGVDGLLHISEMSWGRVENPRKVFKVGDEVRCFIKDIKGEKIALSCKFEDENPWIGAEDKYAIGTVVTGRVARMTDFGAFIVLEPGIDALLHVSQISDKRIDKPSDVLKTGQEIQAKVVDIRIADKKISLSMKALNAPENTDTVASAEPEDDEPTVNDVPGADAE